MRKWILILAVVVIGAIIGYNYVYQDHRDIENEIAEFTLSTNEISAEFSKDAVSAEAKFLNKTIEISGTLTELNAQDLTIDDKVFCQLSKEAGKLELNSKIKVKGRVIGYDELLEQVKLDQCAIILRNK